VLYPSYPVEVGDDLFTYEFHSDGTTGRIRKLIFYEKIFDNLFNLGFGDWDQEKNNADDSREVHSPEPAYTK
jgi:hypothetical protein